VSYFLEMVSDAERVRMSHPGRYSLVQAVVRVVRQRALDESGGNCAHAAELLGENVCAFRSYAQRHDLARIGARWQEMKGDQRGRLRIVKGGAA
jgi:hypothetical protein